MSRQVATDLRGLYIPYSHKGYTYGRRCIKPLNTSSCQRLDALLVWGESPFCIYINCSPIYHNRKDKSQVLGLPSIAYVDASPKLETYTPQEDSKKEGTDSDPSPAKSGSKPAQSDSSSLPQSTCNSQVELPQSSGDSKKPQEEEEEVCHGQTSEHSSVSVAEKGKSRKQKKKSKTSGVSNSASADDCYKESEKIQSDIPRSKSEVLISTTLGEQPQEQHQETQHQSAKVRNTAV